MLAKPCFPGGTLSPGDFPLFVPGRCGLEKEIFPC